ncbi:unnamed protein product [Ascophyllum nodosum]
MIPPKRFDIFSPCVGCYQGLDAFRFFSKIKGNAFIRCCMTANAASPPVNSRPLVLDAETAEVKVERLWGMVDARAPPSLESSEMQSPEEVVDKLRTSLKLSVFDSPEEGDNFFEEEVRASALKRYHYDEAVDMDDSSDDKEYYI